MTLEKPKNESIPLSVEQRATNLGLSENDYKALKTQVTSEIENSRTYSQPKWDYFNKRIKIYNNRKRDETAIGDPLAFTHFQTFLAALYDDKLRVNFVPRAQGDAEQAENLNPLFEYDAVQMEKRKMDFMWTFSACFFGKGLLMMTEWDSELMIPRPEIVNMLTWHRDPKAKCINGKNGMRFGGRPMLKTWDQLTTGMGKLVYKNLEQLKDNTTENPDLKEAESKVNDAYGLNSVEDVSGDNKVYTVMEWFTIFKGKRVLVATLGDEIIRHTILKDQDQWPILERSIFPDQFSFDGTSLLDLTEDKQRMRARVINAVLFNIEANTHQMNVYDANKIKSSSYLNYGYNKNIGVMGDPTNAVVPIRRQQVGNEVDYIMKWAQDVTQRATGATEIQQGAIAGSKRTATEIATVSEGADTRFSLASKILGWSEADFARYWVKMYKMYFNDKLEHKKVIRINGIIGFQWKSLKKKDIIGVSDPDVKVESKIISEAKRLRLLQNATNSFNFLVSDQNVNKEFLIRNLAKLNGYTDAEMEMLFVPDSDRLVAKEENIRLSKGESVKIHENDDDIKHIDEHQRVDGSEEHIKRHFKQLMVKAKNQSVQEEVKELQAPTEEAQEEQIKNVDFSTPKILQTA